MQLNRIKRSISLLLVLIMVLSLCPVQAFAAGTEEHDHHDHTAEAEPAAETTEPEQLQAQTDALLLQLLGTPTPSEEMARSAADAMDADTLHSAKAELLPLIDQLRQLTEEELQAFGDRNPAFVAYADAVMAAEDAGVMPMATSGTVLDGRITVTDTAGNVAVSGNTVKVTVKGSGGFTGGDTATNTVTVTNTSGSTAEISFDYSCSASGTFTFSESSNSGTFRSMMAAGETKTMTMTATGGALWSSSTATLNLTNFSLTTAQDSSRVTVDFDSSMGGVTADGTAVTAGTTLEGITPAEGVQLVAKPAAGYTFACWVDPADGSIVAYDAAYTLKPMSDVSIKAMFVPAASSACFRIGKTPYYSLNDALAAAGSGDVIILVNNGTLPAGDYTIPSGITLLIPYDESGVVFTTEPASAASVTTLSAYRTLTLAEGANLTVNGTLSVTAKHYRSGGRPVGKYGHIALQEGSDLKVNGKLYAYGYITGKGNVKIMSGASVYEYFQIIDFRGGSATLAMYGKSQAVFPLSQYYVQNVEAPMTLEAGATEYGYTTLYMSSTEYHSTVKFIGTSGAMFNLTSGSVTKAYDGASDRLLIKANGTMTLEPMSLSVSSMSINSEDYVLPINSSITIELQSGTATIKQDLALQPNAELIVDAGATCALASGVRLYVYDMDQWGSYVYGGAQLRVVPYAPGRTYKSATSSSRTITGDAAIQVAGTLDTSAGKLYTTEGGAAITGVEGGIVKLASVSAGTTYQATQSGSDITFVSIPVTSAKLQNADGGYLATSANTYSYEGGVWGVYCDHSYTDTTVDATCTTDGSVTHTCSKCGRSYSETLPALGHTPGQTVIENVHAATCTQEGSQDSVVYCTVCNAEISRSTEMLPAFGHSWDEGAITTAPGCLTEGEKTYTCGLCGEKQTELLAILGHDMVYTPSKDATCTEPGEAAGAYCSRCDYVEAAGGVIPALGHDWAETARTEPTCTDDGSISSACARCGETRTEVIAATGHSYTAAVTAPTCTAPGYTTHTCANCGHSYVGEQTPPTGHRYETAVTAPTCTAAGFTTYTCTVCGDSYLGDETPAVGHDYGDGSVTKIATCTEDGVRTYTCSVCGDSYDTQIPALGHDLKHHDAKLASYTSVGWDAYEECARCDHTTYTEYPILTRTGVSDYETFLKDLLLLEQIADRYVEENPGEDPAALVLNYIRTGIPSYTTASWAIMAGNENTDFTAYVLAYEDAYNTTVTDPAELISVVSIRELGQFPAPSDPDFALEFTHMFGTMDITSHNPGSVDHADVAGWAGDLVDLLDLVDGKSDVKDKETVEEMVSAIFAGDYIAGAVESFGRQDMYGDLDAFYIMEELGKQEYHTGLLTEILRGYFVDGLTDEDRAAYFLENRMNGTTNRAALRAAVYAAYVGNRVNTTLEGTRTFASDAEKLYDLRMAVCYAFADYLWKLSGDYVEDSGNASFTVTSSESVLLAPGITRQSISATAADGAALSCFVTTAELGREDVRIDSAAGEGTVLAQAQGYDANVLAAVNAGAIAAGSYTDSAAFAGSLTGTVLVQNGASVADSSDVRTAGTAAGVTRTGKAVLVTVDNATAAETAQLLLDAGCVTAYLLDSGESTSFVSRTETEAAFTDHTENPARVGSVLLLISTAPDDTAFDHAVLSAEHTYLSVNGSVQLTATGVTARGSEIAIPEGELAWSVSDEAVGTVSGDGVFTAKTVGDVQVMLSLNGEQIGSAALHVVTPDTVYFTSSNINAYYGEAAALPLAALYQRKPVAIAPADVRFAVSENDEGITGGTVTGFDFIGSETSGLKTVTVTAALAADGNVNDTITVTMYNPGDVVFDFDQATGGDRQLAWLREISNATTEDDNTYYVVDPAAAMVTDYTFAIDMSAIAVPEQLKELTSMLPGADETDGTAWGFLLQLADRVSDLSEVRAAIQIDPNFDVDLSGLSLQNEYFTLSSARLDPETNVLNVTLNWVKQFAAIEPATANPICVVSGIKLTPKAGAAWDESSSLTPSNSAVLSYEFYLSAGALYTFASDAANQAAYGLTPYVNPTNTGDRGASFGADYASFRDTYTLVNALKNGWYFENGQNVFYVDGVLHTQHTPGSSVVTAPTCTEGGYTTHVCAVCGVTYVADETAALGHSYDHDYDADCNVCGETREVAFISEQITGITGQGSSVDTSEPAHDKSVGNAFDGDYNTFWATVPNGTLADAYLIADLGGTCTVNKVEYTKRHDSAAGYNCTGNLLNYIIEVSTDGETWTQVASGATVDGTTEITFAPVRAAYVRLTSTSSYHWQASSANTVMCVAELAVYKAVCASHTEEVIPGKAATCTETGLTEGKKCSVCGEIIAAQEEIPALGHTEEVIPGKEATCTETGLTEGKRCTVCGVTIAEQTEIPITDHTYDDENDADCNVCGTVRDPYKITGITGEGSSVDTTEAGFDKSVGNAFDGDYGTFWATVPGGNLAACYLIADLGDTYTIDKVEYTKRHDAAAGYNCTGNLLNYIIEVSTDGETWTQVASGDTVDGTTEITFTPVQAAYVRLTSTSSYHWQAANANTVMCVAELAVYRTAQQEETAPLHAKVLSDNRILALSDCEYLLTGTGENTWSLSHAGTYYVKPAANGTTIPQTIGVFDQLTLTASGDNIFIASTLATNVPGGGSIHIWTAGKDVPYWDRCGSAHGFNASNGTHELSFFRADENGTGSEIPGYTRVTYSELQSGESYLIAARKDSDWYIMNPSASTEKFDHIALLVTDAVTHTHAYTTTTQDATCSATGLKTDTCTCGHVHTEIIPVDEDAHTEEVIPAKAATCTESGLTEGKKCSICGEIIVAQEEIPATGHTAGEVAKENEVIPTCTTEGSYDIVVYCTVCGEEISREAVTVPALGHTEEIIPGKAATCTETGLTEGKKCSVCGEIIVAQEEIPATGHTEEIIPGKDATCTETGLTEGKKCSVCGETLVAQEEIPALGHSYESVVTAPTCTEGGYTTYTCSVCGDTYVADEVAALGHTEEVIPGKTPTCTETGLTEGKKCSVCGEILVAQEEIPATGHTAAEPVRENEKAPTCTEAGSYDSVVYCTVCGEEISRETMTVAALGHTEEIIPGKAATCTETGLTEGKKCSVCGEIIVAQEEIPATGHTEEVIPGKDATCTETGLTEGKKCSVCGETLVAQEEIPALGHTPGEVARENEVVPTCTTAGSYDIVVYCTVCGEEISRETVTVDALGHTYDDDYDTTCNVCGETREVDFTSEQVTGVTGQGSSVDTSEPAHDKSIGNAFDGDYNTFWATVPGGTLADAYLIADLGGTCTVNKVAYTKRYDAAARYNCTGNLLDYIIEISTDGETWTQVAAGDTVDGTTVIEFAPVKAAYVRLRATESYHWQEANKNTVMTAAELEIFKLVCTEHTAAEAVRENEKAPSCTEAGSYDSVVYCTVCGEEISHETVAVDALGHTYESVVTAPTCTESGYTTYTCTVCGDTYVADEVAALGHTEEIIPGKAATCTETGLTEGKKCSVCGEIIVAQEEIPATGHTAAEAIRENEKAPTCTEAGSYDSVVYCSVCGEEISRETVTVAALGHTEEIIPGKATTCTETGLTEGKKCSVCGETLVAQEEIPATGHTEEIIPGKDATCTETGLTEGMKCSVCGEILVAQEEIPALGHTEEVIPGKAATCTETGLTEGKKCSICGEIIVAQEEIPATGHSYESVVTAPTCTESGYTTYTCTVCGDSYVGDEVAALGHTEGEVARENEVVPTCTTAGSYDIVVYCTVCGEEVSRETVTVAALGHTYDNAYDPTCNVCGETREVDFTSEQVTGITGQGSSVDTTEPAHDKSVGNAFDGDYNTFWATVPGGTLADAYLIADLGGTCTVNKVAYTKRHDAAAGYNCTGNLLDYIIEVSTDGETWTQVAAGDTVDGTTVIEFAPVKAAYVRLRATESYHWQAANANTVMTAAELEIFKLVCTEHTAAEAVRENEKAPTCTEAGSYDSVVYCTVCGEEVSRETVTVAALGHTEEILPGKAPTCTESGLTEGKKCSVCGEIIVAQEEIPATGHTEEIIPGKDATCTESGLTEGKKCSVCGETLVAQEEIPATGHTEEIIPGKAPTCTETGLTEGKKCSVCGEIIVAQEEIPATGHTAAEAVRENEKAPTCTEAGSYDSVVYCTVCGEEISRETVSVDALGHTEEIIPGKEATCTETGLTEGKKCSVCGEILVAQEEIPATGHTEEVIPGKDATCTETGLTEGKKCSVCGETLVAQEEIPATGHTEETIPGKAPTCTETGLTEGKKCSVCGEIIVAQEEIPATGHTEEIIPGKAATCTETGLTEGKKCSVCGEIIVAQEEIPATGHTE
ncbi:MAG: discoidin domain-containing protein, partial [Oscillospiraceae bacterium]|nr:discoidin domain-containing protein [Oscillospiraceae bacterium]